MKGGILLRLCTIGLGYIGLPTAVAFALHGVNVIGVDIKEEAVKRLNNGAIHIEEPGLQNALHSVWSLGNFNATLKPEKADVFIIAVPTPNKADEYKSCDLTYVMQALEGIIPLLEKENVIIIESTIAPRTMEDYVKPVIENAGFTVGKDIYVVHCPERVMPGNIMYEIIYNNRIVGGLTPNCTEKGAQIYKMIVRGEIIKTDAKTAEMAKLMENTYRDVNIALANELAKICNELKIDALEVINMSNKHPRVHLHSPGPGVGGHCLAVDPYFIISKAPLTAQLINLSRNINNSMTEFVMDAVDKLLTKIGGNKITIFGLTYKGNIDDIRKSPAMDIYKSLVNEAKYEVVAYDPYVNLDFTEDSLEVALTNSSLVLVLTDHNEFKELTSNYFSNMHTALVFDTKNIVEKHSNYIQYINFGNLYEYL